MQVMRFLSAVSIALCCLAPIVSAQEEQTPESGGYRVGIGDVIDVKAFQEDEISGEFSVAVSGAITFPLLGTVPVAGMIPWLAAGEPLYDPATNSYTVRLKPAK